MSRLVEFLLARIDETEAQVDGHVFRPHSWDVPKCHHPDHVSGYAPVCWKATVSSHVLATCKAHRAIVEFHGSEILGICQEYDGDSYPCRTLRALATIWSDHPDYDEGWAL